MPRVAIVGSGLIGRSWAIVFAGGGFDVALYDGVAGVAEYRQLIDGDVDARGVRNLKAAASGMTIVVHHDKHVGVNDRGHRHLAGREVVVEVCNGAAEEETATAVRRCDNIKA